ncbi:MAG TPA: gamma-glutamyl-gamma-aminobutyrate hydrolase family protein [Vicinamibacterales bacterium]|nr:gamma-glutamyl-gamma-aminobutyrate hydrolase family protein [Vicinamibacterales bacterium]
MSMDRPVIGVAWPKTDYVTSLERAGAEIRVLTPAGDPLPGALASCDGVLLTGGPDVDPVEYGEPDRHPTVEIDRERDDYELALARFAIARDVPLLAICRGAQVLNVAAGGTLVQDIPTSQPSDLTHTILPRNAIAHDVQVADGTCLALLLAPRLEHGMIGVNSRHHQSVKDLAPGFVVAATAPDGVVEAIEKPDAAFCVGVQWHPENFWRTGQFKTLFDGLVDAARQRRASATHEGRDGLDVRRVGKQVEGGE